MNRLIIRSYAARPVYADIAVLHDELVPRSGRNDRHAEA